MDSEEGQTVITKEIAAWPGDMHNQMVQLEEACRQTGEGLDKASLLAEKQRRRSLPAFKDFQGSDVVKPIAAKR